MELKGRLKLLILGSESGSSVDQLDELMICKVSARFDVFGAEIVWGSRYPYPPEALGTMIPPAKGAKVPRAKARLAARAAASMASRVTSAIMASQPASLSVLLDGASRVLQNLQSIAPSGRHSVPLDSMPTRSHTTVHALDA